MELGTRLANSLGMTRMGFVTYSLFLATAFVVGLMGTLAVAKVIAQESSTQPAQQRVPIPQNGSSVVV